MEVMLRFNIYIRRNYQFFFVEDGKASTNMEMEV